MELNIGDIVSCVYAPDIKGVITKIYENKLQYKPSIKGTKIYCTKYEAITTHNFPIVCYEDELILVKPKQKVINDIEWYLSLVPDERKLTKEKLLNKVINCLVDAADLERKYREDLKIYYSNYTYDELKNECAKLDIDDIEV